MGDISNNGSNSFILKQLIITDGALIAIKDSSINCMSNCELSLINKRCLLCSSGYVENNLGICILSGSCTLVDPNIRKCRD